MSVMTAGELLVRITPDTTGFAPELRQKAEAAARAVTADVRVDPNTQGLARDLRTAASRVSAQANVDVDVNPDVTGLAGEVNRAAERATAGVAINVPVVPSTTGLAASVAGQGTAAAAAAGTAGTKAGKAAGAGMLAGMKGMLGPLAAVGGAAAGLSVIKGSIAAASDLGETQSKVNQIFGTEGAAALNKFAATSSTALGQTKQQALDASATFGIFGKSANLQGPELAGFSSGLTTLATDMASFGNTSVEDAIGAIGGALRGETEPIRRYGVMLDADTIAMQAFNMGLVKSTVDAGKVAQATKALAEQKAKAAEASKKYGAGSQEAAYETAMVESAQIKLGKAMEGVKEKMTPQAKVLATQALLMKQTKDQQGDFARTSGGLANQQRILSAQWGNMKTTLGTALLPAITAVVTKFNEWMPKIMAFGKQVGAFLAPVKAAFQNLFGGDAAGGGPGAQLAGIAAAFQGLWATIQPILQQIGAALSAAWATIGPEVTKVFGYVQTYVTSVLGIIAEVIRKVTGVIRIVWEKWGTGITNFVTMVFGKIVGIVSGVMQAISGVVRTILAVLKGDWSGAWQGLVDVVKGIWKVIQNAVTGGIRAVGGIVDGLWALFKTAGVNIVKGLWAGIGSVAKWLGDKFTGFFSGLPGIVKRIFGIDSPSKVMAGFGVNMVQGMVVGMDRQRPALVQALNGLVPTDMPTPTFAATPGRTGAAQATTAVPLQVPTALLTSAATGAATRNVTFETHLHGVQGNNELVRRTPLEIRKAAFLAGVTV